MDVMSTPKRRRSSFEVLQVVTELAEQGLKLPEIASRLEMSDARDGALCRALRRADRHDLIRTISGTPTSAPSDPEPTEHLDPDPMAGRRAIRRGGIVRWVAA